MDNVLSRLRKCTKISTFVFFFFSPPFREFMTECLPSQSSDSLSAALSLIFTKMWKSERQVTYQFVEIFHLCAVQKSRELEP